MTKNRHNPWPASRKFKLPKEFSKPIEREIVVLDLPSHEDQPHVKKLVLVSDKEMSDLADQAADIGAKLREPEAGEREEFVEQFVNDSWRPLYDCGIASFRLPAPWC